SLPLPAGLADVVRGHARRGDSALARAAGREAARRRRRGAWPARAGRVRRPPAALDPRAPLPVPVHGPGRARLVAAHRGRGIPSAAFGDLARLAGVPRSGAGVVSPTTRCPAARSWPPAPDASGRGTPPPAH